MVALVGHVSWSAEASWPAGTEPGDLVIMRSIGSAPGGSNPSAGSGSSQDGSKPAAPSGWQTVHTWSSVVYATRPYPLTGPARKVGTFYGAVFARLLSSVPATAPTPQGAYRTEVTVYRGSSGVGATRTNTYAAPAKTGGAVHAAYTQTESDLIPWGGSPSGMTALGSVSPVMWTSSTGSSWDPSTTKGRCATAWTPATGDGVTGDASGAKGGSVAIEVLPPAPPEKPLLTEPAVGEVAAGVDLDVAWRHRPVVQGGYQGAWSLMVSLEATGDPAVWRYWDAASGTLVTSETVNEGGADRVTLPGSLLTDGRTVMVQVVTVEALDGMTSPVSDARTNDVVTRPSVVVTAPSGTVSEDLTPTMTWTPTTPRGSQTAYERRVLALPSGEVIWSGSGTGSATSVDLPHLAGWVNGGQHRTQMRIRQTGGSWSAWTDGPVFTMSWTPPPAPVLTVTDGTAAGRHGAEVTLAGITADETVQLQRSSDSGWVEVSTVTVDADDPTVVDVRAPYGVAVTYRARRMVTAEGGIVMPGAWGDSAPVTSTDHRCYLMDAVAPLTSWRPVSWVSESSVGDVQQVVATGTIGDPVQHVTRGAHQGSAGSWTFRARTVAERETLAAFLRVTQVLELRRPAEREWDDAGARVLRDTGSVQVRRTSPLGVDRQVQSSLAYRLLTVEWTTAAPVTGQEHLAALGGSGGLLSLVGATVEDGPEGLLYVTVPGGGG